MNSPLKLLYVCTHNACRSILAEVISQDILGDRASVSSAGSSPAGRIHPLTLRFLEDQGYIDVANQQIRNYQKLVESWTANIVEMNETVVSLKRRRAELDVGMAQDTQQLDQLQKDHFSTQQALCALVRAIQNCDQGSLQECLRLHWRLHGPIRLQ